MQTMQRVSDALPELGNRGVEFFRRRLGRFTRFEQILALLLMGIPCLFVAVGDNTPLTGECGPNSGAGCRDSISAFHDLSFEPVFYMPMTVAAFMFITNAVVRAEHVWNALAGISQAGLVFFDHDDFTALHGAFATAFFAVTMFTVAWFLPKDLEGTTGERVPITGRRIAIAAALLVLQVGLFVIVLRNFNLLVAEAVQLWVVAGHYILHSIKHAQRDAAIAAAS